MSFCPIVFVGKLKSLKQKPLAQFLYMYQQTQHADPEESEIRQPIRVSQQKYKSTKEFIETTIHVKTNLKAIKCWQRKMTYKEFPVCENNLQSERN